MRQNLYIHVGFPKTGSSALQEFFAANSDVLGKKGVCYPIVPVGMSEDQFRGQCGNAAIICDNRLGSQHEKINDFFGMIQNAKKDVLISSEGICQSLNNPLEKIKNDFSNKFDIKIIAYIRRADGYVQSLVHQFVKYKSAYDINLLINNGISSSKWILNRIENYSNLFGKNNIIVRCYEKKQLVNESIFDDFLSILGLSLDDEFIIPRGNINPSFVDRDYFEMRRLLNHPAVPKGEIQNIFTAALWGLSASPDNEDYFKPLSIFSPAQRLGLIENSKEDYEKIAREYLGREDGQLFYDPLPDPDEQWEPYPGLPIEKVVQGFGYICAMQQEQINLQREQLKNLHTQLAYMMGPTDLIKASGLFDAAWYLDQYPEVREEGLDPIEHYCLRGWREGKKPSDKFDTNFYLDAYPDVKAAGVNPLLHYILPGQYEGRKAKKDG